MSSRKPSHSKSVTSHEEIEFQDEQRPDFYVDPEAEKRLVRKLDWRLIPWLCLLYLISFLDRTNIGNAVILGLGKDLGMNNDQFLMTLTIFFITYSLFGTCTCVQVSPSRGPVQYLPQEIQTPYLASHHHGHLGWNASLDGVRQELWGTVACSCVAWCL